MSMHAPPLAFRARRDVFVLFVLLICGAAISLSVVGCLSGTPAQTSTKPNFGPPMQDVRTEAKIVEMENEYNAAKNSQPTHQAEAQADAARKAKEKEAKAKAAQEAVKTNPEPAK
jgi:hypothetical protein